ncbi:hypothetical protein CWI38_0450p0020 [Hamiltosporidium tvaerminnensis]|uniref:Uncharacterized protein n=1 Tax=Hamiltosporidium tvaerminnensis TaxID=1176355 RepID=A0A4V6MVN3_9MICR|nr:hypothetical protein CWI38_0450p0020 [Hamiltosporidium tvaerminnensis]
MAKITKKAWIGIGIAGAILVVAATFIGIGYAKAGTVLKNFEDDYKKVSESDSFKTILKDLNDVKLADFVSVNGAKFFQSNFVSSADEAKNVDEALRDKKPDVLKNFTAAPAAAFNRVEIDTSKFASLVGDIGFLAKLGFVFRSSGPLKSIRSVSECINKIIKDDPKEKESMILAFISLADDKETKITEAKVADDGKVSSIADGKTFKRQDKGDVNRKPVDFVAFIAEKVKKQQATPPSK